MALPEDFLTQLEQYQMLSERERDIFIRLFARSTSRSQIALALAISESNINTCLSGIYRKFSIASDLGRGKENHLRDYLTQRYAHWRGSESPSFEGRSDDRSDVNEIVQQLRQQIGPSIQQQCGTMRVLDMTQPIAISSVYTSVNILERITGRRGLELTDLIGNISPEQVDRFTLGDVREERVPGLEAVQKFSKLMILGKPGAGKTTFLKHLAIQCMGGIVSGDRLPLFVTLKDFAEAPGKPDLLTYCDRFTFAAKSSPYPLIFNKGKALVLLDGLDEVREADSSRILRQIRDFAQQFPRNQFVITCRIAAREYTFEQFTEVEIADFDDSQISDVSSKWFHHDPVKATQFIEKLKHDAPIRELATSPLLLTLLCLVFEDSGSFPSNRSELYENGVDVLLKKWDVKRNIERDQIYKKLSLKRKEDLLSHVAHATFQVGNYFFKRKQVERHITHYIQNLPDASTDLEALELDSAAVLRSIETQHGLFVERARGIYSFSHLTFHEYFTARKIAVSCNPYEQTDSALQALSSHLTERRWREVILLTVGMMEDAGTLLRLVKAQIDALLMKNQELQDFLFWVSEKSASVNVPYKATAVRAFYLTLALDLARALDLDLDLDLARALDLDLARALDIDRAFDLDLDLAIDLALDLDLDLALDLARALDIARACSRDLARTRILDLGRALARDLSRARDLARNSELHHQLQVLREQLPEPSWDNPEVFRDWWQENGQIWTEQLRTTMIWYRNIGHDWQFCVEQKQLLQQYYDANKLLVDCLNNECYISRAVRQEIEAGLLMPIARIKSNA